MKAATMDRRSFLGGLAGILACGFAPPAVDSRVLMPVKVLELPERDIVRFYGGARGGGKNAILMDRWQHAFDAAIRDAVTAGCGAVSLSFDDLTPGGVIVRPLNPKDWT